MTTMFVRHQVTDFDAWKKVYDEVAPLQQRLGVTAQSVYRSAEDQNEVTVTHEFASLEAAQQFMANPELQADMKLAGVAGQPTVWYGDKA